MRSIGGVLRPHINCSVGYYLAKSRMKFIDVWVPILKYYQLPLYL